MGLQPAPRLLAVLGLAFLSSAGLADPAPRTFHLMQIEKFLAGADGNPIAQAIQLRMRASLQSELAGARVRAWDAAGQNPVVLIDFDASVANAAFGSRVLVCSPGFLDSTSPPAEPDFFMDNVMPGSYFQAGSITYESDAGAVYWRLSWGGDKYTGPTNGLLTNDDDGNFGPAFPGAMPTIWAVGLAFQGGAGNASTSNVADYRREGSGTWTNNDGESFDAFTATTKLPKQANGTVVRDAGSVVASVVADNGLGFNARRLEAPAPPVFDSTWSLKVDCSDHAPGLLVLIGTDRASSGTLTRAGEILVDFTARRLFTHVAHHKGGTETFAYRVPRDVQLAGTRIYAQALISGSPGSELTNAIQATVGRAR